MASEKKKSTTKKTTAKKTNNTKKRVSTTKKTATTAKKKTNTPKKNTTTVKKSTVVNKTNEKKSYVKTQKISIEENKVLVELKNILNTIKKFFKSLKDKYNKTDKYIKWLINVSIVCVLFLIVIGIMALTQKKYYESKTVFYDSYNGVVVDNSNAVVVGTTDVKETIFDTNVKDNSHGKITKYDYKGNIEFQNIHDKGYATAFNSVISVEDGYIVVGTGVFSEEEKNNEGKEALIIKYDKDGEIVWEKFYHVLTDTSFKKVIEVEDGYVAVGQSIYANLEVGNHTTGGAIIVKYDKEGNEIWHNNHGGTKSGNFNDVVSVNGEYYAVGKDGTDWGNIVKFDKNGKYLWHKNYSYTDGTGLQGIAYNDGYLYVVGSKKILDASIGDNDDRSTTNTDAVFIKFDLEGNIIFEKLFGGSNYEKYNSILVYHNNFYIVGHICSTDAGLKVIKSTNDKMSGLIVRYDINGYILKKEVFGGSNNDNLTDIDTDGISLYAVGYSNSKDGNINKNSNGKDYRGKLIKLNSKFKTMYVK